MAGKIITLNKDEVIKVVENVNNKITFTKWFKKHLKEMYDLSDYAIKKVMNAFEGEIKKTELMKLIESK